MLKRNMVANLLGTVMTAVMGLAFVPIYLAELGPGSFGLIGVFAILMAAMPLLDLGMTPTLTREVARYAAGGCDAQTIATLLRSLELICWFIAVLFAVGVWAGSDILAGYWFHSQTVDEAVITQALAIAGLVVACRLCEGLYRGGLNGFQRQVLANVLLVIAATLRGVGSVVVLIWVSPTIEAYFIWQAAVSLGSVAAFAWSLHRCMPKTTERVRFAWNALMGIRSYASGMLFISVLALLLTQIDKVILSKLLTLEEYAYYALAAMVSGAITMAVGPVVHAMFPRFVEAVTRNDLAAQNTLYHQAAQVVTVLVAPMAAVMAFLPWGVIWAWTGDPLAADQAAPILGPLALGTFLNALMWVPYHSQLAHGWTSLTVIINSLAVLILVPTIILVVPGYGAVGAAYIWLLLNAGYVLLGIRFMHRRILQGEMRDWYVQDLLWPTLAAMIPAAVMRMATQEADLTRMGWAVMVSLSALLGAALSLLAASNVRIAIRRVIDRAANQRANLQ